ncbi:MAG: oxidoreductase [Candidatus Kaiserbacteria bacterium]|nr:oxidoreductase [Candidatus Kaiserbacteria bacterium]
MSDPLGVAVIGYGYWSPKLIRNIIADPGFKLVAICEKDSSRHERIRGENPGAEVVQEYKELFARADIQAVIIATIPSSHFRIAKQALENGRHVLVEKPLTLDPIEAELLVRIAKEHKLTLMIDHTYLYAPAIRALREQVRSGTLGTIYSLESTRVNLGLFQRDTNVVWDLAPHDVSILLSLFDERPAYVSVVGSKTVVHPKQERAQASVAHIMLFYSTFVAHIDVSWISPVKIRQITVIGSERTALYDQLAPDQLTIMDQGVYPKQDGGESGPLFEYKTGESRTVELSQGGEDLASMLADFQSSVRTGAVPVSSATLGLDVVRILSAADRSLRSQGKKISIDFRSANRFMHAIRERYIRMRHSY